MNNIKTVIIDDEKLGRDIIKNYLASIPSVELAAECANGFEGIKAINDLKPDLIFLDIQMPKINGFEMLEIIEEPPVIIFTTAFDQYALKAFEVNATDYLMKPFSLDRFKEAVNKALKQIEMKEPFTNKAEALIKSNDSREGYLDRVVVKTNQKITIIPVSDITYMESQDDYVMLHTPQGKYLKQKTMKFFEERLDPKEFVRIHRTLIVRLKCVKQIELFEKESYRAILHTGEKLAVSKTGYQKLKEIF
jgi:two-component system, LytTR family, response regulator